MIFHKNHFIFYDFFWLLLLTPFFIFCVFRVFWASEALYGKTYFLEVVMIFDKDHFLLYNFFLPRPFLEKTYLGPWMVLGWFLGVIVDENPRTMSQHKNLASEAPQRLNKEWNMSISKKFDWISVYFSWINNISDGSWRFLVVLGVFAQKQGVCRFRALPFLVNNSETMRDIQKWPFMFPS